MKIMLLVIIFLSGCAAIKDWQSDLKRGVIEQAKPEIKRQDNDSFHIVSQFSSHNDARRIAYIAAADACLKIGRGYFVITNETEGFVQASRYVNNFATSVDVRCYEKFEELPDDYKMTDAITFKSKYMGQEFFPEGEDIHLLKKVRKSLHNNSAHAKDVMSIVKNAESSNVHLNSIDGQDIMSRSFRIELMPGDHVFKFIFLADGLQTTFPPNVNVTLEPRHIYELVGTLSKDKRKCEFGLNDLGIRK